MAVRTIFDSRPPAYFRVHQRLLFTGYCVVTLRQREGMVNPALHYDHGEHRAM